MGLMTIANNICNQAHGIAVSEVWKVD